MTILLAAIGALIKYLFDICQLDMGGLQSACRDILSVKKIDIFAPSFLIRVNKFRFRSGLEGVINLLIGV
jgi:hypothetical protein